MTTKQLDFANLVTAIQDTHETFATQANKAVNVCLTMRNWLIGHYIVEYELQGADRANYGDYILERLSEQLDQNGLKRMDIRELRRFRQFYACYPHIRESVIPVLASLPLAGEIAPLKIRESLTPELQNDDFKGISPLSGRLLVEHISFTHFVELMQIDSPIKRLFYEVEVIRGHWSVRELKRQIATQYFERSGLSLDKEALAKLAHQGAEKQNPQHVIRDPYVFEFLGLKQQEVMTERKLEDALLDKLQNFLLELGHGFCFEARQKKIIIGGEHCFVDLVFYHRILKCHVLVELKNDAFRHENLGQLNAYVSYYKEHQMSEGDQPPIGILLCTQKNHEMVKFALAGMKNSLFVSHYQLQLPPQAEMEAFLHQAMAELETKNDDKSHPWRRCSIGKHFVKEHILRGAEKVREHCAFNPSHKEELSYDEIQYITQTYFNDLPGPPVAGVLDFDDADTYDSFIRGWTHFWNDIFKPSDLLDANYIKALIATESGFRKDPPENPHAHGLMQLLQQSFIALQDIKGELHDYLIRAPWEKILDPTTNICMGIRWLFQKRHLLAVRLKREVTWEEAVIEYKSYWEDIKKHGGKMPKGILDLREYYKKLLEG